MDQIVVLLGMPSKITAFLGSQRKESVGGYEDACTALLHYDGGTMATVKVSAMSAEDKQLRFWVRGERGSYKKVWGKPIIKADMTILIRPIKFYEDLQEAHLAQGMRPGDAGFGIEPEEWHGMLSSQKSPSSSY